MGLVLLQCAHCGAPLDVRDAVTIVKCGYCGYKTERARFVTIAEKTPETFAPPKVWRPPAHVPASSDADLPYKKKLSFGGVLFIVAMVALGPSIVAFALLHDSGTFSPKVDVLAGKSIDGTPAALAVTFGGGRVSDTSLYIKLDHPEIDQIYFTWEKRAPSHPYNIGFIVRQGKMVPSAVCARLAETLGVFGDKYWNLGGASVSCDPSGTLSAHVSVPKDAARDDHGRWKKRVDTLYRVVIDALLGAKPSVTNDELRRVLGAGYAVSDLARVDIEVEVDVAAAMLQKALNGAVNTDDGQRFTIQLAGTPLPQVSLSWTNSKGGKLSSGTFYSADQKTLGAGQAKVAACLTKTLGTPEIHETDHLKKTVYYSFARQIHLYDAYVSVQTTNNATWKAFINGLDGCTL